ncbi:MAG: HD domain-containing protein [Gammaproteobacteria bacterium]|nr:HD domain-containing protein [Gammaproteobacteria bacterium]MDH5592717.1 HD domain-containing protein [Gammaproteobacteria bacterium]
MYAYDYSLFELNKKIPLRDKLTEIHQRISTYFPFIVRISITIYDAKSNTLKTYLQSGDETILEHYQTTLDNVPSLKKVLEEGVPRVINRPLTVADNDHEHTRKIAQKDYAASYTLPMISDGKCYGFIFFNADEKNVFKKKVLTDIDMYAHIISLMVINELTTIQTLVAALRTVLYVTHTRDPETGEHLERMSRYSRLIATEIAEKYGLDDSYIEHLFMFAPMHDIGKTAIPDNILLKAGKLDSEEMEIMKRHSRIGRDMIDMLIDNFGMQRIEYIEMLSNVIEYHHEAIDGSGYPSGLKGNDIPLEARIVAVADVFDALTSERPYKEAWSNDRAIEKLKQLAGKTLEQDCVNALLANMKEVESIQERFKETV